MKMDDNHNPTASNLPFTLPAVKSPGALPYHAQPPGYKSGRAADVVGSSSTAKVNTTILLQPFRFTLFIQMACQKG